MLTGATWLAILVYPPWGQSISGERYFYHTWLFKRSGEGSLNTAQLTAEMVVAFIACWLFCLASPALAPLVGVGRRLLNRRVEFSDLVRYALLAIFLALGCVGVWIFAAQPPAPK